MRDDTVQAAAADAVLGQPFQITTSVLVELGWVLGSIGGMGRSDLARSLGLILNLPTANVEGGSVVRWAVERFATTGDLADLVHLASSTGAEAFGTFDKQLLKDAGPNAPIIVLDLNP